MWNSASFGVFLEAFTHIWQNAADFAKWAAFCRLRQIGKIVADYANSAITGIRHDIYMDRAFPIIGCQTRDVSGRPAVWLLKSDILVDRTAT